MMLVYLIVGILLILKCDSKMYFPDWESLDSRPLPTWYDESKIGIFIHWGVFAVPAFGDSNHAAEWFWWNWQGLNVSGYNNYMSKNYPPSFTYGDFARDFRVELFNPDSWADLFNASGAQYIVLTSKHHEGYCNWNTKYSWNWNSVDVGPKMDLVNMLATSIRKRTKLKFGIYHSLYEWFHKLYIEDKNNKFQTANFVKFKTMPELYEIVNRYKPEIIWSDGDWEASDIYWNSTVFLAWLYNSSPVKDSVITNDRWGSGTLCKHGGFYSCADRYNPGKLLNHKWENCFTLDKYSWGFRREMTSMDVLTIEEIISQIASTVSCGGNALINVGPTQFGTIPAIFEERLLQLGTWLKINGESIYKTKPWIYQKDEISNDIWYTSNSDKNSKAIYAIILKFPSQGTLKLNKVRFPNRPKHSDEITLLGYGPITYQKHINYTVVIFPQDVLSKLKWAWTLKITGVPSW